jgi:cell division protein FtsN
MDYQYILEKVSDVALRVSLLIAFVGLAKVFMINYFLLKITQAKKTEIKFSKNGKTASYTNFEDQPEKVIRLYKQLDPDEDDLAS